MSSYIGGVSPTSSASAARGAWSASNTVNGNAFVTFPNEDDEALNHEYTGSRGRRGTAAAEVNFSHASSADAASTDDEESAAAREADDEENAASSEDGSDQDDVASDLDPCPAGSLETDDAIFVRLQNAVREAAARAGENTGRWSKEEHSLFLHCLKVRREAASEVHY